MVQWTLRDVVVKVFAAYRLRNFLHVSSGIVGCLISHDYKFIVMFVSHTNNTHIICRFGGCYNNRNVIVAQLTKYFNSMNLILDDFIRNLTYIVACAWKTRWNSEWIKKMRGFKVSCSRLPASCGSSSLTSKL
jgi:hypothetical protein